jgi:hypothetical protein
VAQVGSPEGKDVFGVTPRRSSQDLVGEILENGGLNPSHGRIETADAAYHLGQPASYR